MKIFKDIIIQFMPNGRFLIYNVFTRNNFLCENDTILLCQKLTEPDESSNSISEFKNKIFKVWDLEYFSNENGLLADPTRVKWNSEGDKNLKSLDVEGVISFLIEKNVLIGDIKLYESRFGLKTNPLDSKHFGNFHQQLGYLLMIDRRIDPTQWWLDQKFTDDRNHLRENLYKSVQGNFLKKFFPENIKAGMKIIDIGCGIGFYANRMAEEGASVIGIDPSEKYIGIARNNTSNVQYYVKPLGKERCLEFLETNSIDAVFISDSLLFYFVPFSLKDKPDIKLLLEEISRILKPSGRFWSIEPHYTFWLSPWFGENERPFTILTEYKNRKFLVTPTISDFVSTITANKFVLSIFKEIYADGMENGIGDKKGINYASQFPLWHFFEFLPQKE
ncbi:MAG: methyltransferase domain-containing protein [Candidatus Riflebacteria bacterium]|nr:methyltransferase domain-containing protein [Candidatus Riflebacteria bacterium]